jgi:hypothetical protein
MTDSPGEPVVRKRRWPLFALAFTLVAVLCVLLGHAVERVRTAANRMSDT